MMNVSDPKCVVCGEPAAEACAKCGLVYCAHHRGAEEGEEGPPVCWNCRQAGNARAVLFWVVLGAVGFVALITFFSLWY